MSISAFRRSRIGNRWRLGGRPLNLTPLRGAILYTMDSGGGDVRLDFNDQVSLLMYYTQLEEDLDRYSGSTKIGEDYLTGGTLMLKPFCLGWTCICIGVYGHGQAPFGPSLTSGSGPFNGIAGDTVNVTSESRYYLGFDSRYRFGNTSIEPGFFYLLGTRTFCTPVPPPNTGTPVPCTSPVGSPNDTAFDAFQGILIVNHATGPWLFASQRRLSLRQIPPTTTSTTGALATARMSRAFDYMGVDGSHDYGSVVRTSRQVGSRRDVDDRDFRRMGEAGNLDRFGWMNLGGQGGVQSHRQA